MIAFRAHCTLFCASLRRRRESVHFEWRIKHYIYAFSRCLFYHLNSVYFSTLSWILSIITCRKSHTLQWPVFIVFMSLLYNHSHMGLDVCDVSTLVCGIFTWVTSAQTARVRTQTFEWRITGLRITFNITTFLRLVRLWRFDVVLGSTFIQLAFFRFSWG